MFPFGDEAIAELSHKELFLVDHELDKVWKGLDLTSKCFKDPSQGQPANPAGVWLVRFEASGR
jgi:hypothetical protein